MGGIVIREKIGAPAAIALYCAVAGAVLVGCGDSSTDATDAKATSTDAAPTWSADKDPLTGIKKITADGHLVNVSCSGSPSENRPVIVLLHGGGDDLTKMADLQRRLTEKGRVCSYDRLGAGDSDLPHGRQDLDRVGRTLTAVLDEVAGDEPVVLAGHSMGGMLAARYAPDHPDRIRGLVLMDATSPTAVADLTKRIPESAPGPAGDLRDQILASHAGKNPERLVLTDQDVRSAGDIPVRVIRHGKRYLAKVPTYGPGLEEDWAKGQQEWQAVSRNSEGIVARNSGHTLYADEPEVAVRAVERVAAQVAEQDRARATAQPGEQPTAQPGQQGANRVGAQVTR
ncbi:alpha/beta fold hydrolase [Streptomyces flavofungini]|uniref:alpha/beta fold hydrolase n=1 Tax=Streptomyces flavofungini TaxID=68200 RepID=UPI003557BE29